MLILKQLTGLNLVFSRLVEAGHGQLGSSQTSKISFYSVHSYSRLVHLFTYVYLSIKCPPLGFSCLFFFYIFRSLCLQSSLLLISKLIISSPCCHLFLQIRFPFLFFGYPLLTVVVDCYKLQ